MSGADKRMFRGVAKVLNLTRTVRHACGDGTVNRRVGDQRAVITHTERVHVGQIGERFSINVVLEPRPGYMVVRGTYPDSYIAPCATP